ncbi:hypothetical protein ACA910_009436 [Epithemia clementina (nom. ined.)]
MSGRGRSYRRGRTSGARSYSGRGRTGRSQNPHGQKKVETKKKGLSDYMYYLGSAKTAADYEVTTRFLINWICKNYEYGEDIASLLENGAMINPKLWEPTLRRSTNPGDSKTKEQVMTENKQYEMIFKEELTRYFKEKEILSTNTVKVYAFLWEQCSKSMQMKIESRKDFTSTIEKGTNRIAEGN